MRAEILPPLTATLHVKPKGWRFGIKLWLPLFLLWLLLLPLVVLALLAAFHGTKVEVENPHTRVFIKVN